MIYLNHKYTLSIIIVLIITSAGIFTASNTFKQQGSELSTITTPIESDLKKVITPNAYFQTKIFLDRKQTFISIPFKFDPNQLIIWLNLFTEADFDPIVRLASHPQLMSLKWSHLTQNYLTLYQRNSHFRSVEEFINNPPPSSEIIMDYKLARMKDFSHLTDNIIEGDFNLDYYNYILTTYIPLRDADGFMYYETIIDASEAIVNEDNELTWLIFAPDASEDNFYFLGNIHVDYRQ